LNKIQRDFQEGCPPHSALRLAQRETKIGFFMLQIRGVSKVLQGWGNKLWTSRLYNDNDWAIGFSVFLMLILLMDKTLNTEYYHCENRIKNDGHEAGEERAKFQDLVRTIQTGLYERTKEIFHWKFKTHQRQGGVKACNPIRDGIKAFDGVSSYPRVDNHVANFVRDLQAITEEFSKNAYTGSLTF
jgi:hypothetical protein